MPNLDRTGPLREGHREGRTLGTCRGGSRDIEEGEQRMRGPVAVGGAVARVAVGVEKAMP